jgi:hypothetical protein
MICPSDGMHACSAEAAFLSTFNVYSRLALGKWEQTTIAGVWVYKTPIGTIVIPPPEGKAEYYRMLIEVASHTPCIMVPEWAANALKAVGFRATMFGRNYLYDPHRIHGLPGGDLKRLRNYVNRADGLIDISLIAADAKVKAPDERLVQELLALNKLWYRRAAERKFRTHEKVNIDWCLTHWSQLAAADPSICLSYAREKDGGKLIVFELGCALTNYVSVAYCERYDADGPRGANLATFGQHCLWLDRPVVNDGPADGAEITALKEKLSAGNSRVFYTVERKPRRGR